MELRQYLAIILRRKWIIIISTIVGTLVMVVITALATPQYVSRTTLRVATINDINYTQLLMNTYARIATSATVKSEIRQRLSLNSSPVISVELIPGTELMTITAEAPDPVEAQEVAATTAAILAEQSREIYSGSGATTTEILKAQLDQAELELNQARADYDTLVADSSEQDEAALDALNQSIALKERTYSTLLDQYERARTNEALLANSVSVVEPANEPANPAKPNVPLNIVLGVVGGLFVGLVLAFLFENLDTRLHTTEQIEAATRFPTVGKIPTARDQLAIAKINNGHFPQLEAFRRLRTNILTQDSDQSRVVLVTSAQRGEGKSTVSSNLAVTIAQSGRQVVIVDCDMRLPTVHKIFGILNKRGLTSVLTKEVDLEEAVQASSFPRVHVITSGPLPPNPTELLGSQQMFDLIAQLREEFDFVLLDTPALLSVADAAVLVGEADNVIWVVSRAQTRKDDIETVRQQLLNVNVKTVDVVINRASDSSDYTAYSPESYTIEA